MDVFEKSIAAKAKMSDAEKNDLDKQNKERCLCPTCPTYADCAQKKKELVFCFVGKSGCIKASKGCHCPGCKVRVDFGLTNIYYCLNGTEQEIRSGQ
jgi:hypothetical protein